MREKAGRRPDRGARTRTLLERSVQCGTLEVRSKKRSSRTAETLRDIGTVLGGAGAADGLVADVAPEHLDRDVAPARREELERGDGERVALHHWSTRGPRAVWAPSSSHASRAAPERRARERNEDVGIAEEARHVDEQIVMQRVQLVRVLAKPTEVRVAAACARGHPARDPAPQRRRRDGRRPRRSAPSADGRSAETRCRRLRESLAVRRPGGVA